MFLKHIKLKNFRNYKALDYNFNNKVTVLVGDNAQGKSNVLESIYFLATTKSPKAEKDEEIIKYREEVLRVEGQVQISDVGSRMSETRPDSYEDTPDADITNLEITMQLLGGRLKKSVKVNGIPRRATEYSEHLTIVMFAPEDINLVGGSPSLRRSHIDQTISQSDRQYKKWVSNYENIVIRKNRILKAIREGTAKVSELDFWSNGQVEFGEQIVQQRRDFFDFLNETEKKFGDYKYNYLPSLLTREKLLEYQSREIDAAVSLIGPHRDDFVFLFNNLELSKFGSRGEQRTAVLDLKFSETSFVEFKMQNRPVLLLDDIFSELDLEHKKHVVELAKLQQTIITTVELDKYLQTQFKEADVLQVEGGIITKKQ